MADKLNIIAISGSLRARSYNTMTLKALQSLAGDSLDIEIVTLKGIPVYDGDDEAASGVPEIIRKLNGRIAGADGVIIATPEYNFSIPGGLKNATDWISRFKDHALKQKRVGIVGASMSPVGTARAQYHLRQNLVGLESWTMNKPELFVSQAQTKFDDDGELTDEDTEKFARAWLDAFEAWVRLG
jgi:chromate reductase, NAD(P)H dehydrogenase (quinone)